MPLILLLLLAAPAGAHLVAFPHSIELSFTADHVDVVHTLQIHRDDGGPAQAGQPADLEATAARLARTLEADGPRLTLNGQPARCETTSARASRRRGLDAVLVQRCHRPPGALDVAFSGPSPWSTGLVPVTVQGPIDDPSLEGEGAPLAGRDPGPWVGALAGPATLRFVVPAAGVKLPAEAP